VGSGIMRENELFRDSILFSGGKWNCVKDRPEPFQGYDKLFS
jgi:hypothetical protein